MKLLVAGSDRVDAGKTTFSVGLCRRTDATGYKPRAGNDYWFDHDDYRRSVAEGRLYGKDARRLAAASPGDTAPEELNPVHRLWTPTPGRGKGLLGREGRAFVCDRVRVAADLAESGRPPDARPDAAVSTTATGDAYVVNGRLDLPASARDALPLADAPHVSSLAAFDDLMERLHAPALAALGDRVAAAERAVVESYADVARPLTGFEPDAVAVVEPRRCRVYDGRRYAKGCEVASGSAHDGRLEERVANVVDLLDPVATVPLPALAGDERADPSAVASAYDQAYDALLGATP